MLTECCEKPNVKDLSQGIGERRHYYCMKCFSHHYNGKQWTAKQWDEWINGTDTTDGNVQPDGIEALPVLQDNQAQLSFD